jgi:hypothetical protein
MDSGHLEAVILSDPEANTIALWRLASHACRAFELTFPVSPAAGKPFDDIATTLNL